MDDDPRDPAGASTRELRDALDAVLAGEEVAVPLTNPNCSATIDSSASPTALGLLAVCGVRKWASN